MTHRTLLVKARNAGQLRQIERHLKLNLEGLAVDMKTEVVGADGWVRLSLSGEDENIAMNLLRREVGFCPERLDSVARFSTVRGFVVNPAMTPDTLQVDIGVFQPETVYPRIPLRHLQAVLADGRKLALRKIAELFGFCEGLPLSVKITDVKTEEQRIDAELAADQIERFAYWRDSLLDRLVVLGATLDEAKRMTSRTGLNRDIVIIESLSALNQALTCKLGTDATGLVSEVGRNFRNARIVVFNPRGIRDFLLPYES